MKVFIDHYPSQEDIAYELAKRIRRLNKLEVIICAEAKKIDKRRKINRLEEIEKQTLLLINETDIYIPLISSSFIGSSTSIFNDVINFISDSKEKIIFPVICEESTWSSINWIVKSKVFPEDGIPMSDLTEEAYSKVLDEITRTIENIFFETFSPEKNSEKKNLFTSDKIVFISHDHEDADFAELMKLQFEKHNIFSWIDGDRLKVGQDWREEIDEGISKSIALIAILTPEAKKSEYATYEWAFAWGKGIKIFPLMLKQTPLHPRLESLQYLDFTNRATRPWDKLISSIKELL